MALTEVVFELADPQYPLCNVTREHEDFRAVYRVVDTGQATGLFRATLTLVGPSELTSTFVKELKATRRYDEFEVLSITPYAVMLKIGHRLPDARAYVGVAVMPTEKLLDAFGSDTILEPFVVEQGRIRVRCLIPQPLETKRVLLKLQELQRSVGWKEFRVIRVAEFKALRYASALRRLLGPEQEDLLRLALALGYYTTPKGCTLEDIAKRLGLSVSPVHKKLKHIEQVLINAHVDPSTAQAPEPRRRGSREIPIRQVGPPGAMCEVSVRMRWPAFMPAGFTARHPGARVVLQSLAEDPRTQTTTALLVALAPERDHREFIEGLERDGTVESVEITTKAADHLALKFRAKSPSAESWWTNANPFAHLVHRFGRDAYAKPVVCEGEDVWFRLVVVRALPNDEIVERIEGAAKEAGWSDLEILSLRRVEVDPAVSGGAQGEKMTARQEEVLKIAHALGYYKTPRECTLETVAATLGISANAIHKNLTAAEQKIITSYLNSDA